MKKIALLSFFVLFVSAIFAQNSALSVPKFKGLEITGTVDQFGEKLSSQGFKYLYKEGNNIAYIGRFAGFDDCIVTLIPVENSKEIACVVVFFGLKMSNYGVSGYDTWELLLHDYEYLKDLLTEKYGNPAKENDGFASNEDFYYNSSMKLYSVKEGKSEYYARWGDYEVDKMVVGLSLEGGNFDRNRVAFIALRYLNVEKDKISQKEVIDDL